MTLKDVYELLKEMEEGIGCGCSVSFRCHRYGLEISATWEVGNAILNYRKIASVKSLYSFPDEFPIKHFIETAITEYKLKTTGEE